MLSLNRRSLLAGVSAWAMAAAGSNAATIQGALPWHPAAGTPPAPVKPGIWTFFTPEEGAAIEALVDRLIPDDDATPGAKWSGVATYLDRQLAGPYGRSEGLYMRPPFAEGLPTQGNQSPLTPAQRYRQSLAALDQHVRAAYAGKTTPQLSAEQRDALLTQIEHEQVKWQAGISARAFFDLLLKDTKEGYFADPVYGGNRDMVSWKMIGFPGARYDYRDWITRHNEPYPKPPVGIAGRPEWVGGQG